MMRSRGCQTNVVRALVAGALVLGTAGLAGHPRSAQADAASPFAGDPSWIAYQTFRNGHEGVWLIHPDGRGDHEVDFSPPAVMQLPDWSPDGARFVVTSRGGDTEPLYEYDLATEQTTQLFDCQSPCLGDDEPAYAPDGVHVAFERALAPFVNDVPADCGLWVGDRTTGAVRQLTSNALCDREYYPRWSPDGSHLTYQRELPAPGGSVTTAVFTISADGSGERRLTDPALVAGSPDWSPDGQWIVFSTHPLNVFQSGGSSNLYRVHPDGTGLEQLTAYTGVRATEPHYSPDGSWVVFVAVRPRHRMLWAIPADDGRPVVIAKKERIYTHPNWQALPASQPSD
jgi:Tol biopolymer transport system component